MKEMCRNFVCNNNCQKVSTNATPAATTQAAVNQPDTSMRDCSSCVMNRIGLAQAYVPSQPYNSPMDQERSLICGTTFSELVMPYCSGWNLYRFRGEA